MSYRAWGMPQMGSSESKILLIDNASQNRLNPLKSRAYLAQRNT